MMPNKFVFQTEMKQNNENLNFLSCSIVLNIVLIRTMVSQCIVIHDFFLLEMPEHTELDTEHSDTMQFKNNIVRTTDENIPTGSCSKWGLAPNTHNYSKEKNFPKIKGL